MNDKFDDIILRLQAQQPTLDNADELTAAIMAALPDQQPANAVVATPAPRIFYLFRNISSAAAVFLIALFVWQYNEQPELTSNEFSQVIPFKSERSLACDCLSAEECMAEYISQHNRNMNARTNTIEFLMRKHHENY